MSDATSRFEMTYQRGQILGRGASGVAFVVRPKRDLEVKLVAKEICFVRSDEKRRREAFAEGKLLQTLSHSNIVQCLDVIQENDLMYIVMEYANGGDLSRQIQIRRQENKLLSEYAVMAVFVQICAALGYIHQKRILHRDLKPANIFIVGEGELSTCSVKLGDFGIAKMIECTMGQAHSTVGTPSYLSPEICKNHPYGMKSDVWSLGIVLYELMCLKVPFHAGNLPAMALMICTSEPKPVPDEFGAPLAELAKALLQKDPDKRPQVAALLQRPYVRSFLPEHVKAESAAVGIAGLQATSSMPLLTRGMSLPTQQQSRGAGVAVSRLPSCGPRERQRRAPEQNERPVRLHRSERGERLKRADPALIDRSGEGASESRGDHVLVERHERHHRICRSDRTEKIERTSERGERAAVERVERLERQGVEVPRLGGSDHAAPRPISDGQGAGVQQPAGVLRLSERAERAAAALTAACDHRGEGRNAAVVARHDHSDRDRIEIDRGDRKDEHAADRGESQDGEAPTRGEQPSPHSRCDGGWIGTGDVSEICAHGEGGASWGEPGGEQDELSPLKVRTCAWHSSTSSREPKVDSPGGSAKHVAPLSPQAEDEASSVGLSEGPLGTPPAQAPLPAERHQDPAPPGDEPPTSRLLLFMSSAHDANIRTRPKRSRHGRRLDTLETPEETSPPPETHGFLSVGAMPAATAPPVHHHAAARSVSPSVRLRTELGPGVEVPVPPLLLACGSAPSLPPLPPLLAHGASGRSTEAGRSKSVAALHDSRSGRAESFQPLQRGGAPNSVGAALQPQGSRRGVAGPEAGARPH